MARSITAQLKRSVASFATQSLFIGADSLGLMDIDGLYDRDDIRVMRDIPYGSHPDARLDVLIPPGEGPFGVVMHVHGGGFSLLSKDTHWMVAEAYARAGYLVFNVDYRLAPEHTFPAAHEDVAAAYEWIARHAPNFGGDFGRFVLAGESAGANLVLSLAVAATFERPESFARRVFATGVTPTHVVPASGLLDLSSTDRLSGMSPTNVFARQEVERIRREYLSGARSELASPLLVFESDARPDRPLPEFFVPHGGGDPLAIDSERLAAALDKRGASFEAKRYRREPHSFHVFMWRRQAQECWRDTFDFLGVRRSVRRAA